MKLLEIFQKTFVQVKSCCIFAPALAKNCLGRNFSGHGPEVLKKIFTEVKAQYNEQENISAIKEKKKEQTRF